jgi:hypothetical protein
MKKGKFSDHRMIRLRKDLRLSMERLFTTGTIERLHQPEGRRGGLYIEGQGPERRPSE